MKYFSEETVREICKKFVIDSYFELYMSDKLNDYEHIELSESHGDLIDRQATLKIMAKVMCKGCKSTHSCSWCTLGDCKQIIAKAPTILEASKA